MGVDYEGTGENPPPEFGAEWLAMHPPEFQSDLRLMALPLKMQ